MKIGSLFSGGGLGDFGFMAAGMDISWQCEIDEYCQKILVLRYPESKKYRDIKTLKGADLEPVDIITGGFPCQPFSVAGQQMGKSDDRYLWPEMFRVIQEVKPRWVVVENVSGVVDMALDDVCANLESAGYEVGMIVFPAHALGAPHRRERVWIIANFNSNGSCKYNKFKKNKHNLKRRITWDKPSGIFFTSWDETLNKFSFDKGIDDGIADRVHRLKMLGNGQVPACTHVIGKMIMEIENAYGKYTK